MITCQICHASAHRRQCGILPPGWRIAEYREGGFSDFGIICPECDRKMKTINNNRGNNMSSKGEREFPALKPCPFCGCTKIDAIHTIEPCTFMSCSKCGAHTATEEGLTVALARWNLRTYDYGEELIDKIDRLNGNLERIFR